MAFTVPSTAFSLFTGKGGVGKTSLACAAAVSMADGGHRTLIVSTDPASNLDEVLGHPLTNLPTEIPGVPNLFGMNIDPEAAARRYRERAVGPYRGVLPEAALRSMEESLSGACTTEIAAFDEFTEILGGANAEGFGRVVFDTAPTGHTLRLLSLPAAWTDFMETSTSGVSCLGPLAALQKQQALYASAVAALGDGSRTTLVLVARPDVPSLKEAARASRELASLGIANQRLILNGVFEPSGAEDEVAMAFASRQVEALHAFPVELEEIPTSRVPLLPRAVVGVEGIRTLLEPAADLQAASPRIDLREEVGLGRLVDEIARRGRGVVMTMGKGGVGKTSVAAAIARELAQRGHRTVLTTTDPAAHVLDAAEGAQGLVVERIDPKEEVRRYSESVMASVSEELDADGRALLEEDLRSPCTEEIAVFRAFADTLARGDDGFVIIDTAPTGHTILLLDAAEAYHREVLRSTADMPESVTNLLPRLRDPQFTKVLIVAVPEPTPVHEAAALAADLRRAGIEPFGMVVNQSLAASGTRDALLSAKAAQETGPLAEARALSPRLAVLPWSPEGVAVRPVARQ